MRYFLVRIEEPYIGLDEYIVWSKEASCVVKADDKSKATTKMLSHLPDRDPKVQEALAEQSGFKEGEYFSMSVTELSFTKDGIAPLQEPSHTSWQRV